MRTNLLGMFAMPTKFKMLGQLVDRQKPLRMLDVGAGCDSCRLAKRWFPSLEFHGIDRGDTNYCETYREDYARMDRFFDLNLEEADLSLVPDNCYDIITATHVIEHITTGAEIVSQLAAKLKLGGVMYIEFPGPRSLHLPGGLWFHSDPTHVRVYDYKDVANMALKAGLCVVRAATRRDWRKIVLFGPAALVYAGYCVLRRRPAGRGMLDLAGCADYVLCQKRNTKSDAAGVHWTLEPAPDASTRLHSAA